MSLDGEREVLSKLDAAMVSLRQRAVVAMERIAAILEGYAKTHHAWTPQTGATDMSTRGFIEAGQHAITAYLTAGMDYNVFLELARDGKWAWLWPAVEANLDVIRRELEGIVG